MSFTHGWAPKLSAWMASARTFVGRYVANEA